MNKHEAAKILNLPSIYSRSEVKAAHRALVLQHHPDKGGDSLRFIEIQEAYELLTRESTISVEEIVDNRPLSELGNKDKSIPSCWKCHGFGYTNKRKDTNRESCRVCHGRGYVYSEYRRHGNPYSSKKQKVVCISCDGIGWRRRGIDVRHVCDECEGSGRGEAFNPVIIPGAILTG